MSSKTLHQILSDRKVTPYTNPLRVKVIATDNTRTDGPLRFSIADSTQAAKATCLHEPSYTKIKEGRSLVLVNYTVFKNTLMLKSSTSVGICKAVEVPDSIVHIAEQMVHPQEEPVSPTKEINKAQAGTVVSIEGTIAKVEDPTMINMQGQAVQIRNIEVQDQTGKARVALWRDKSDVHISVGDQILVKNATTSFFNGVVVNTNFKSTVTVTAPTERQQLVTVIGIDDLTDADVSLLCESESGTTCHTVPFTCIGKTVDELIEDLPFKATLVIVGIKVTNFQMLQTLPDTCGQTNPELQHSGDSTLGASSLTEDDPLPTDAASYQC